MSLRDKLVKALKGKEPAVWTPRPEILLCPPVPKPMHGMAPRVVLGQAWWNRTRQAAYRSTNYHCLACGVFKSDAKSRKWLEGHELYDVDYPRGRMTYVETVPLCHYCHNYVHCGRLEALRDLGKVPIAKYVGIIQHGNRVLREAGLTKPLPYAGKVPEFSRWRLVVDGTEYKGLFKNQAEWQAYHSKLHGHEGIEE